MRPSHILSFVLLAACAAGAPPDRAPAPEARPRAEARQSETAPSTERAPSIYELPVGLRDADGREIGLDVARGGPVLIAMFYASCPVACPVLIDEMKHVVTELEPDAQAKVRMLLVSFDPARDTPAVLRTLARERGLDDRWTVAVASDADARALSAALGIKYRKLENGEFYHGATIVVLDPEGRPIARTDRPGQREAVVAALR
ncbi:MAG TPA: SCO family protein [Kofleriaceae bacterium]|jgi:protein SCO1/2|nr:SCO family protein [Kofleriaceae bacterium]